jgi:hypothetical protein
VRLSEAFVNITLQARGLLSGLRAAENQTEKTARNMGRSMQRSGNAMTAALNRATAAAKGFIGTLAASLSIGALVSSLRKTTNELDRLADASAVLGTSATNLAAFGFAAEQMTGLSAQQAQISLERFVKQIGESAAGAGEAQIALNALGLDAERLAKLPLTEAFIEVGAAISQVASRGQQLTVTQKLFGDEARKLLPLLTLEESSLRALLTEYEGLAGNIDAAAMSSDALNNSLSRINASMFGLKSAIVVNLVRPFEILADTLRMNIILLGSVAKAMGALASGDFKAMKEALFVGGLMAGFASPFNDIQKSVPQQRPQGEREIDISQGGSVSNRSIGLSTQLGTFNISRESVSLLRNIAESNKEIARSLEQRENVLGSLPLT